MLDTDGDGRLSVREMRNAVKLLADLDRDGDGMISRTEIPRCTRRRSAWARRSGQQINRQVVVFDAATGRQVRNLARRKPPRGPEWFRKMDRNGDGDVSRREFLGTDAQFRRDRHRRRRPHQRRRGRSVREEDARQEVTQPLAASRLVRGRKRSCDGDLAMKRLLVFAVAAFAVCGRFGTADTPATPAKTRRLWTVIVRTSSTSTDSRPILMRLRVTVNGRSLTSVWDDYVTKVFRHLDTNGDGFLDKVEVQRLPPPGVLFGGARGPTGAAAPALSDLDADGDGKVSRAELAAYFRRAGYGPFQVAGGAAGPARLPASASSTNSS